MYRVVKRDGKTVEFDISKKSVVPVKFTVHTRIGDLNEEVVVNI